MNNNDDLIHLDSVDKIFFAFSDFLSDYDNINLGYVSFCVDNTEKEIHANFDFTFGGLDEK